MPAHSSVDPNASMRSVPPVAVASSRFAGLAQDVRYAARLVRRQPRHALITILTMAIGIGATTVLFSVTYGVLMRPLPWPHADRIVVLKETRGGIAPRFGAFTNAAYLAWRPDPATIENLAAWSQRVVTITGTGDPERIRITAASATLFAALGVRPLIGSLFEEKDEASPVVVLSETLWRQRFGGDPAVLGRPIQLDGESYTAIGVLPEAQAYPDRQTRAIVPYAVRPTAGNFLAVFNAVAALRPGVTAAQAASEGTARGRSAADTGLTTMAIFGSNGPVGITAQPLRDALTADVRQPLLVLLAAVGLLLVTATANVASLQLARTTTRSREMAIRAALGAGGARVTRQLLVESLLLGLSGGGAGLALTWILHRSLPSLLPVDFPRVDDLGVDAMVVVFALTVSVGTGILFGLLPALRARRLDIVEALAENGTAPVGAAARTRTARARLAIMTGQVAVACVLLVGASLLVRSFVALLNADRGYGTSGIVSARLSMPASMYPSPERRLAILNRVLSRLGGLPGVRAVAFTSELPLTPGGSTSAFTFKSPIAAGAAVRVQASPRIVSAQYFSVLGMRMIAGRSFSDADTETSERGVVVNQAFARRYLGDSPLGWKMPVAGYGSAGRPTARSHGDRRRRRRPLRDRGGQLTARGVLLVPPDGGPPSGPDSHASGERPQCGTGHRDAAVIPARSRRSSGRRSRHAAGATDAHDPRPSATLRRPARRVRGLRSCHRRRRLVRRALVLGVPAVARAGDPRRARRAQVGYLPARLTAGARRHARRARSGSRRIDMADARAGDSALRRHAARPADVRGRPVGASVRERPGMRRSGPVAPRGSIRCGC